jgi:hypothetical protein
MGSEMEFSLVYFFILPTKHVFCGSLFRRFVDASTDIAFRSEVAVLYRVFHNLEIHPVRSSLLIFPSLLYMYADE